MFQLRAARAAACLILLLVPYWLTAAEPPRSVLDSLAARSIGPATMGGRITDLAVVESNPDTYYVATAGGGVWKTTDGGPNIAPLFDNQPTMSTGAVAVCQAKPEVVYVGTGEGNPRNSVSQGGGVFKSIDGGKTWTFCGLKDTHHIGRVVVHPLNPDIVYVAALGHFWGANKERGLYRSTDGGKTWTLSKFIDENTGFVDLQMDPSDSNTLYAAAWEVRRDAFSGGNPITGTGPNGGLFKTTDGGVTWEKLTEGLPAGPYGRCGLSISRKNPNNVLAVVQTDKTNSSTTGQVPTARGKDVGPVETGGIFRSEDKGKTWKKINDLCPRPFYYGQIRIDPTDEKRIYVLGTAFYVSDDGGTTFTTRGGGGGIHPDHHALWINPKNSDHVILGNDGGLYISKDRAKSFVAERGLVVSQFYGVGVDMRTPYRVYGGLQDNGSWGGPTATPYADGISTGDWRRVGGGDGFQAAIDPTNPDIVYVESQYGALSRVSVAGAKTSSRSIRPTSPKGMGMGGGGVAARYNWNSPILLSPHNPKTLYYGGQFLYKTENQGDKWERISPDLSRAPKDMRVTNSGHTILATAESPVHAGVLWVGTDDGNLWLSKDDGRNWIDLTDKLPGVPRDRAIPKIECSSFASGTAFVAIDRHRNDDFKPYIFKTTDFGETWVPLVNGLPNGAVVGVVRQSSKNKDLLFAGTELGLYVSFDGGKLWQHLNKTGLPACVRVDDLVIHPRERELVIGTHGRGIWIMDIAPLEQLTAEALKAEAHLFTIKPVTLVKPQQRTVEAPKGFKATNPKQGITITFLATEQNANKVTVTVVSPDPKGDPIVAFVGIKAPTNDSPRLFRHTFEVTKLGEYTITMKVDEKVISTQKVQVKGDPTAKADE